MIKCTGSELPMAPLLPSKLRRKQLVAASALKQLALMHVRISHTSTNIQKVNKNNDFNISDIMRH